MELSMYSYPSGTKFTLYSILKEKSGTKHVNTIRRWVTYPDGKKKFERYDATKYKHFRDDEMKLSQFLLRLNNQSSNSRQLEELEIEHAFINKELLENYKRYLLSQIPTQSLALTEFSYLRRYFLDYFINKLGLVNPVDWHRKQTIWAESLLRKEGEDTPRLWEDSELRSAKLIKNIVNAANRFMRWLHMERPDELPPLLFKPVSRASLKELDARRTVLGIKKDRKFLTDEDWSLIETNLPESIKSMVLLAKYYGLRRSEVLGLKVEDVRKGFLSVERQIENHNSNGTTYRPLKGREARAIPHWFSTPKEAYIWITDVQKYICDKDTFSQKFTSLMNGLNLNYTLHELRHTWVTLSIEIHSPDEVRKAAGHKDLNTTNKYLREKGKRVDSEAFDPDF
jgi:integrase